MEKVLSYSSDAPLVSNFVLLLFFCVVSQCNVQTQQLLYKVAFRSLFVFIIIMCELLSVGFMNGKCARLQRSVS